MTAPLSLIITAYGPVSDARLTLTPQLKRQEHVGDSLLVAIDLSATRNLGGSCLAQVYGQVGDQAPTACEPKDFIAFWELVQNGRSIDKSLILAYHDRSDGGLLVSILEMCFAGHVGASIDLSNYADADTSTSVIEALFNEELGALIQIQSSRYSELEALAKSCGFPVEKLHIIGRVGPTVSQEITITHKGQVIFQKTRIDLQRVWSETSFRIQAMRDNPICAQQEFDCILNAGDQGLHEKLTFDASENIVSPYLSYPLEKRPKVAILREQGDFY